MSADREPTAVEVIAKVIEERFLDRSLDVWPDFTPEAQSVVERIRAMTPQQQAELVGGEVQRHPGSRADGLQRQVNAWFARAEAAEAECATLRARLAAVEALADEWAAEGADLIKNCYSGRDVFEGETQAKCAADLRAALTADPV